MEDPVTVYDIDVNIGEEKSEERRQESKFENFQIV